MTRGVSPDTASWGLTAHIHAVCADGGEPASVASVPPVYCVCSEHLITSTSALPARVPSYVVIPAIF